MIAPGRIIGLAIAVTLFAPSAMFGQQSSTDDLARRVAALERKNEELEQRVRDLEIRLKPVTPETPAQARSGDWRNLANWRRLKRGMSYDQVRTLLGEPDRISGGGVALWSWGNSAGYAVATFIADELESWTEPKR